MNNYLEYLATIGQPYIHARGKIATSKIVELIDCKPNEKVLEVGCGTGATLCYLAAKYKNTRFIGVDTSRSMFDTATNRAKFSGLYNKIDLRLENTPGHLSFDDNEFDTVYIESVLGIQEGEALPALLNEVKRVLKPKGILAFNETIWLDTTELSLIHEMNNTCKDQFGIIQSNELYPYLDNWKALLEEMGFHVNKVIRVDKVKPDKEITNRSYKAYLSHLFSMKAKLRLFYQQRLIQSKNHFNEEMKKLHLTNTQLMEGIIIKCRITKVTVGAK